MICPACGQKLESGEPATHPLPEGVKGQNPDGSYYLEETTKKRCEPDNEVF